MIEPNGWVYMQCEIRITKLSITDKLNQKTILFSILEYIYKKKIISKEMRKLIDNFNKFNNKKL